MTHNTQGGQDALKEMAAAALKAFLELPAEERSDERPYVSGWNQGWEDAHEQGLPELPAPTADRLALALAGARTVEIVDEIKSRFEYASSMYHNIEQWHGEEAPDGTDLYEWFMRSFEVALATEKANADAA